ncbi:AAA family ATPase [Gordonia sp. C13]|uniref:AAA family ATPase n=1 Tax=Gordonia sp. C13 TaxID=2935078 RepID=UPI00200B62CE|nr:AAA family ATPase [Gordonia sp. C13]MCK8616417.1 AAA family ATPase [Gordonia sp. C13]
MILAGYRRHLPCPGSPVTSATMADVNVHNDRPRRPRRIAVAGVSGAGKTTTARRIAGLLDVPHVEIDALHHGPGWVRRPEFLDDVREFLASDAWVTEWQYRDARPLIAARAELLVWLDLPYWTTTFPRVVRRTVRRRLRREVLWNGNLEAPLRTIFTNPEHIIRWSVSQRHAVAAAVPQLQRSEPGLPVVRLRSQADVEAWLAGLS